MRTPSTEALPYAVRLEQALLAHTGNGRLEIDDNSAEIPPRRIAVGTENRMFAGADCDGERTVAMYSLLETAKLNGVDPQRRVDRRARPDRGKTFDQPARRIAAS